MIINEELDNMNPDMALKERYNIRIITELCMDYLNSQMKFLDAMDRST